MVKNFSTTAAFIWSVANLLRGNFKQSQYGRIILPFRLLRRLGCVLESATVAVLGVYEKRKDSDLPFQQHVTCVTSKKVSRHIQILESMSPRVNGRAE